MSTNSLNQQVFSFLEGKWQIERFFEGSYQGALKGEATLLPQPDSAKTYHYAEHGKLTDGAGQLFDARQNYLYRLSDGKIQVLKQEEAEWIVMHDLDFSMEEGVAKASHVHLCGQDHYAANYQVDFSGSWDVTYSVKGPKKDYRIRTSYAASGSAGVS